jgi:hypothetical protein
MSKAASSVEEDVEKIFGTLHVIERNILLNSGILKTLHEGLKKAFNAMSFRQRLIIDKNYSYFFRRETGLYSGAFKGSGCRPFTAS